MQHGQHTETQMQLFRLISRLYALSLPNNDAVRNVLSALPSVTPASLTEFDAKVKAVCCLLFPFRGMFVHMRVHGAMLLL